MTDSPSFQAIAFDFDKRIDTIVPADQIVSSLRRGEKCWIDLDLTDPDAQRCLQELALPAPVIEELLEGSSASRYLSYDSCVHVYVTEPGSKQDELHFFRVDLVFAENFFLTARRGEIQFLQAAHQNYRLFFKQHAQSLGFMAFECWDGLVDAYQREFFGLEDRVDEIRESIQLSVDDSMFGQVSDLTRDLLRLRRNVIADRETLQQLAIHKTGAVSATTQPYLAKLAATMDRLASDTATEREVLTETLNLYLGLVTHRTNQILSRLTVISVIFLPLTFLVGLYGMNFESQPEFQWSYGYAYFWFVAATILTISVGFIWHKRWF